MRPCDQAGQAVAEYLVTTAVLVVVMWMPWIDGRSCVSWVQAALGEFLSHVTLVISLP